MHSILQRVLIIYLYLAFIIGLVISSMYYKLYSHLLRVKLILTTQLWGKGTILDSIYPEQHSGSLILTSVSGNMCYYFLMYILINIQYYFLDIKDIILNNITKHTRTVFCPTNFRVSQEIIKSMEKATITKHAYYTENVSEQVFMLERCVASQYSPGIKLRNTLLHNVDIVHWICFKLPNLKMRSLISCSSRESLNLTFK